MMREPRATRANIIQAADDLFYGEGVRATSMDAIAERAGVTKRTLYYHFRSKDDLISAYLQARDEPTLARYEVWLGATKGTLAEQVVGMFHRLARVATAATWKGCGFQRAAAELAGSPGHPALKIASAHKKRFELCLSKGSLRRDWPAPRFAPGRLRSSWTAPSPRCSSTGTRPMCERPGRLRRTS